MLVIPVTQQAEIRRIAVGPGKQLASPHLTNGWVTWALACHLSYMGGINRKITIQLTQA
jgi:hypothetical protein